MAIVWSIREPTVARDIDQLWFGSRAAIAGQNPYGMIGPGRAFEWPWLLYYPGTAISAAVPLAPFSQLTARLIFVGVSVAVFTFAVLRDDRWRLWACVSPCFFLAIKYAQWSPLLTAALFLPPAALLVSVKPNLGLAVLAAYTANRPLRWGIVGTVALLALSFVLVPTWLADWRTALASADHIAMLLFRPGGFLVLLAILRWRRPEARLLITLATVPQTPYLYDSLPVLTFVPKSRMEAMSLAALSWVAVMFQSPSGPWEEFPGRASAFGSLTIALIYLPALLLILRRPNEGELPAWLETRVARWPAWLRGVPVRV